eukprot:CAMPEP_0197640300 /NCGR_PEP_ID=MMETSP1338-20131121/14639_1 /TAXON_ID=43686 ORGANISM="Pelagodinium beii, Strain RCC1491" /NCGR_SAMPLE_ID=MMETSP1338 /ASSEMBLY_ACC=CAM_ASM_000754 /LENGTH=330 /DNA_ID=CAMNT_0043213135 /DNA_START=9 /DNA_END=997 /DNA_ORIENTATION=-
MTSAADRVTIVVTTSPIPSHPSPVLLRTLFASFKQHLTGVDGCDCILVCDGYTRADGRPQLCAEEAYNGFLTTAQSLASAGELGSCHLLRLDRCHGYGLALEAALREVTTEFVLVVQHDWLFVKDVDLSAAVSALDTDKEVKYIGMQSLTTLEYARRMQVRYKIELPPARDVCGLHLVPQLLWYDKPHVCRADHYRKVVLPESKMGILQNPERRYGVDLMWPHLRASTELKKDHLMYGTFFWDVEAEVVYHLSGRKLLADEDTFSVEGELGKDQRPTDAAGQLRGEASTTATFTALAVERTMHVAGLALPKKEAKGGRFKGRCYICGQKG